MDLLYLPLILYLLIVFCVPFFLRKEKTTDESYFLAGRSLGFRASFLSVVATETSVATVLIFPAAGYAGRWNLLALCLGYIAGRIFVARYYLKSIYEMTDTSIYKAVGTDNGSRAFLELAYLAAKYISSGVRFFMGGLALAELFGGPVAFWILLTALVAGIYSLSGGLRAVVVTDQLQGLILFFTGLILMGLLWPPAEFLTGTVGPALFSWKLDLFDGTHTIPLFIGGAIVSIGSHGADQDLLQRILAVKNLKLARRSLAWSGVGATVVIMTFVAVGSFLYAANPDLGDTGQLLAYVKLSANPILSGLFAVLVAAASMSTLDSAIHSTGRRMEIHAWLSEIRTLVFAAFVDRSFWSSPCFHLLRKEGRQFAGSGPGIHELYQRRPHRDIHLFRFLETPPDFASHGPGNFGWFSYNFALESGGSSLDLHCSGIQFQRPSGCVFRTMDRVRQS